METPRLVRWTDSWSSPYASELYITGDESLLDVIQKWEESFIPDVAIEVAKSGNKTFWKISQGGEFLLVRVAYDLKLKGYSRTVVDRMGYLPIKKGERFEGTMIDGKNRRKSIYSAVFTEEGVTLTPTQVEDWGDRAYDITNSGAERPELKVVEVPKETLTNSFAVAFQASLVKKRKEVR